MTMHVPQNQLLTISASTLHPLANPYILTVIPFWIDGNARKGDLTDVTLLFEKNYRVKAECLLQLKSECVMSNHGDNVAGILEGRTGLYVVVNDLPAVRSGVCGTSIGHAVTSAGVDEYIVETLAGLIIFAQFPEEVSLALVA